VFWTPLRKKKKKEEKKKKKRKIKKLIACILPHKQPERAFDIVPCTGVV
jgi:hypothetical protein